MISSLFEYPISRAQHFMANGISRAMYSPMMASTMSLLFYPLVCIYCIYLDILLTASLARLEELKCVFWILGIVTWQRIIVFWSNLRNLHEVDVYYLLPSSYMISIPYIFRNVCTDYWVLVKTYTTSVVTPLLAQNYAKTTDHHLTNEGKSFLSSSAHTCTWQPPVLLRDDRFLTTEQGFEKVFPSWFNYSRLSCYR